MKSLRHILTLLITAGISAAVLLAVVSFWGAQRSERSVERALIAKDVTADILPPPMYLIELRLVLSQALEETMPIAVARSEAKRLEQEYSARVSYWREHPPYGLEANLLGQQHQAAERFFLAARGVLESLEASDRPAAQNQLRTAHAIYLEHRAGVDATVKVSTAFANEASSLFQDTGRQVTIVQWIVLLASAALLVALGLWMRRVVWALTGGEPADAAAIANAVAQGNLSVRVPVAPGDDTSVMAALGRMCQNLSRLVDTVRRSSDTIASGSHQIATDNTDLSQRTDQQASGLQQTAASMEQFSSTVKNNAESAREAEQLAHEARTAAVRGGAVVDQVVASMEGITSSTRQVSEIVGVIDDIAFQTNILALNAAVEAARAGEQGRSFAVVASEVQTLARRSAEAAKTIKTLISSSVEQIQLGSKLATDAGANMEKIVGQATQVARLVSKISAATAEQTTGIGQVSTAVAQLDLTTQQNVALVQQSASAAESLNQLAAQLVAAVSVFKLEQLETADTTA